MREIKFRAWDKKEKRWVANGDSLDLYHSASANCFLFDNDNYDLPEDIEFLQYTGLKDKNGKEIYEGDIVKGGVYYGWKNEKGKGIVRFGEWSQDASGGEYGGANCFGWYLELLEQEYGDFDNAVSLVNEPQKHKVLEVIGNIYENPELLTNPL